MTEAFSQVGKKIEESIMLSTAKMKETSTVFRTFSTTYRSSAWWSQTNTPSISNGFILHCLDSLVLAVLCGEQKRIKCCQDDAGPGNVGVGQFFSTESYIW